MKCVNCKGKKLFVGNKCFCTESTSNNGLPKTDCKQCRGTGTYDSVCPYCLGSGQLPDQYILWFCGDEKEYAKLEILNLNVNDPPSDLVHETIKMAGFVEHRWVLPLNKMFDQICQEMGASHDTHIILLISNGGTRIVEFGWDFPPLTVESRRDDKVPDQEKLKKWRGEAIARHFGWKYGGSLKNPGRIYVFVPRPSIEYLISELQKQLLPRQWGFSIQLASIATGEHGYGVYLWLPDGTHLTELSIEYTLTTALQGALLNLPRVFDRFDKDSNLSDNPAKDC